MSKSKYDQLIELIEDYILGKMAEEVMATEKKEEYVDMDKMSGFKKRLVSKNKKIQKGYEEVMEKYAPTLKKLSDS